MDEYENKHIILDDMPGRLRPTITYMNQDVAGLAWGRAVMIADNCANQPLAPALYTADEIDWAVEVLKNMGSEARNGVMAQSLGACVPSP